MEDLPLGRIAALVPEFAVKDLSLGQNTDDDDDRYKNNDKIFLYKNLLYILKLSTTILSKNIICFM